MFSRTSVSSPQKRKIAILPAETRTGLHTAMAAMRGEHKDCFDKVIAGICNKDHPNVERLKEMGVETFEFSVDKNADQLKERLRGIDAVCFTTDQTIGRGSSGSSEHYHDIRKIVDANKKMIRIAQEAGVKCALLASCASVDESKYSMIHMWSEVEREFKQQAWEHGGVVLRSAMRQQLLLDYGRMVRDERKLMLPIQERDELSMVNAHDVGRCFTALIAGGKQEDMLGAHRGQTYTLTGERKHTAQELVQEMSKQLGATLEFKQIDEREAEEWLRKNVSRMHELERKFVLEEWRVVRDGKAAHTTRDIENITKKKPISFAQFIKDNSASFK